MAKAPNTHPGIKEIRAYEAGKYGHAVRGEAKALMYARLLEMRDEDEVFLCRHTFEKYVMAVASLHPVPGLRHCWVSQTGDIYYCTWASHLMIAEHIFLTPEKDFEKTHAKITINPLGSSDPLRYVKKPSNMMHRVVKAVLEASKLERTDV